MSRALLFTSAVVLLFASAKVVAQVERLQVSVASGRPVADAIVEMERRHGIAISYEDLPWVHSDDLRDVTLEVRRDLAEFATRGEEPPRVIVPRGGNLSFSYDSDRATGVPINLEQAISELLSANTDAGNAGTFRVLPGREMMHVVPVARRNPAGIVTTTQPVLDSVISLSLESINGSEALLVFCDTVSRTSGETIVPGTVPINALLNTSITLDENQGVARDTLVDILEQVPVPVRPSWQLFYDPTTNKYVLNIHLVG